MAGWPFAHMPDAYHGTCGGCGRADVVVVVFDGHEEATGLPLGPVVGLCWPCLGRDGDPLHRLR